ncbi:MAG: flagellar hook protein [Lachnospiraceae bacterium]|nr:flagellar hook protein [Lachnospiraceae bacterium]
MVVQHNLTAMNANRMLGLTTGAQSKSTEKLSSGYRINRAADDAAGLSISEKMRRQIRGLDQASTNADDGISAVQTAEGALNEVQDMLQRMNELAVQAANGTNSENDRSYIQSEIDQLATEIDRVAETTKFNETYLLKGDGVGGKYVDLGETVVTDPNSDTFDDVSNKDQADVSTAGDVGYSTDRSVEIGIKSTADFSEDSTATITIAGASYALKDFSDIDDLAAAISSNKNVNSVDLTYDNNIGADATVADDKFTLTHTTKSTTVSGDVSFKVDSSVTADTAAQITVDDIVIDFELATKVDAEGNTVYDEETTNQNIKSQLTANNISYTEADGVFTVKLASTMKVNAATTVENLEFNLHVGADSSATNKIGVSIASMSADGLGVSGIKVTSEKNATDAIDVIANAIQLVSKQRSDLGAVQNRLEHTINNLDNVVENTTAAESRIRDTDMAKEMVKYSNLNILGQAGQSMLAQANQANSGVLSLLG